MTQPNNPPAFPKEYPPVSGMSLRDYFAGQALAKVGYLIDLQDYAHIAEAAYKAADAMLAERAK